MSDDLPMDDEAEPVLRPTARVLLIDGRDRALLFRMVSEDFGDTFWFPPGGAVEGAETHRQAAARELREETGWPEPDVGPLIGFRRHVITWGGVLFDCREQWFLARVDTLDVDTSGFTEEEKVDMLESKWWSVAELRATPDRLVPRDLADLLEGILESGAPAQPLTLSI
jgi:8-oxo-dGTP pyrophosphatase MutT (NUDIX family)